MIHIVWTNCMQVYYWWTASIKPRLLFSRAGYASWGLSLSSVYYCYMYVNELMNAIKNNTKPFWQRHSHVRRLQMQACILRRNKQLACNSFEPDNLVKNVLISWVFITTDIASVCEITVHTDIASVCEITVHYAIDFFVIMYFCNFCMLDPNTKLQPYLMQLPATIY